MRVGVDTVYYASWTNVAVFSHGWHRCRVSIIFQIPTLLPECCALMGFGARVLKTLSRACLAAVNHKKTVNAEVATPSEARALLGVRQGEGLPPADRRTAWIITPNPNHMWFIGQQSIGRFAVA